MPGQQGDLMTFMVLDDDTRYVHNVSNVRPITPENPNFRSKPDGGENLGISEKPIVQLSLIHI